MANGTQYSFQRIEKKYFISPAQAETMLGEMRQHMTADRYGEYAIGNIYCDTDNFRLIRASLEKPAYKEKLRIRCYGVPKAGDKVFVELKKKCGGVVYKRRVTAPLPQAERFLRTETAPAEWGQIGQELQWFQRFYDTMPRMYIGYDRTAWAGTEDPELRITFDRNIRWRCDRLTLDAGDDGKRLLPEDQILMEVKIPGACPLWLCRALSAQYIYPASFSKYGACYKEMCREANAPARMNDSKEAHRCA